MSESEIEYDINRLRQIEEPFVGQMNKKKAHLSDQVTNWLLKASLLACLARMVSLVIQAAVNKECSPMFSYNLYNMASYVPLAILFGASSRKLGQGIMLKQKADYKTNIQRQIIFYGIFLIVKFAIVCTNLMASSIMGKCFLQHGLWKWTAGVGFLEISFFVYLVYRIYDSSTFWKKYN